MLKKPALTEDEYLVPAAQAQAEIKVKGSRFVARIVPALSKEAAEEIYKEIKKKYYNATHNCFAYLINKDAFRYSDDGEPSGTAGKPILQVLESVPLYESLCVVTRYFGGTKLGTGGLIRAYGQAAAQALQVCKLKTKVRAAEYRLNLPYELEPSLRRLLGRFRGEICDSEYSGLVEMRVLIPQSRAPAFEKQVGELGNRLITFSKQ